MRRLIGTYAPNIESDSTSWDRLVLETMRIISGLSRAVWKPASGLALSARCFRPSLSLPIVGYGALSVVFEIIGVFSLLPLLHFIQAGQDLDKLRQESTAWQHAAELSQSFGIPIQIWSLASLTLVFVIARQAVFYLSNLRGLQVREDFTKSMRLEIARKLFRAKPQAIQNLGSGAFVTAINNQAAMGAILVSNLGQITVAVLSFIAYAIGIALISPIIILLGIISASVIIVALQRLVFATYALNQRLVAQLESFGRFLSQFYQAWRLIKLTDQFDQLHARMRNQAAGIADSNVALAKTSGRVQLFAVPIAATLALVILVIATTIFALGIAELTLILVVLFRLGPMAESFVRLRQSQAASVTALARIAQLVNGFENDKEVDHGSLPFVAPRKAIRFDNVCFSYPDGAAPALNDIQLEIPACRLTAIVGPSGAGKSTILDLLPRLIEPTLGRVMYDEIDANEIELRQLRRGVGFVDQHSVLFDGTVAENLRFAKPDATPQELLQALDKAGAADLLEVLPDGLETNIGENGTRLSGGQRQRLAIARAFVDGSSVLVLDEPTSALDFEAESTFRNSIKVIRGRGECTIIIVAHRLSTIQGADFVVVMRNGCVEEAAPPSNLRQEQGYYAKMIDADNASLAVNSDGGPPGYNETLTASTLR